METTGENLFQVKRERSYISCLVKGIPYGFKHLGLLIRYIWPSLLAATLLPFPFLIFFLAQVYAILRKWVELGYLPQVTLKDLWPDVKQVALRSVVVWLLSVAVWLLIAVMLALTVSLGLHPGWCFLFFFVLLTLMVLFGPVVMQISYSDRNFPDCLRTGLSMGLHNWGRLFAFYLLGGIILAIIAFIGSIPYAVLLGAGFQAYGEMQMGGTLDLPTLFPLLVFLAQVIMMVVVLVGTLVFSFSDCLMWGSLVKEVPAETEVDG